MTHAHSPISVVFILHRPKELSCVRIIRREIISLCFAR